MRSRSACLRAAMLPVWTILLVIQLPAQRPPYAPQGSVEKGQSSKVPRSQTTREFDVHQPGNAGPSTTVNSVDVINGSTRRTQVFGEEAPPMPRNRVVQHAKAGKGTSKEEQVSAPSVPEVDVINGARSETRRFEAAEDEITTPWFARRISQSVVVDVASVESVSRRGGPAQIGSTAPVVVGVASSESQEHAANAKPIAYRIAPDPPKRPPYYPGPPGAQ
jgi:hypothetical protein